MEKRLSVLTLIFGLISNFLAILTIIGKAIVTNFFNFGVSSFILGIIISSLLGIVFGVISFIMIAKGRQSGLFLNTLGFVLSLTPILVITYWVLASLIM